MQIPFSSRPLSSAAGRRKDQLEKRSSESLPYRREDRPHCFDSQFRSCVALGGKGKKHRRVRHGTPSDYHWRWPRFRGQGGAWFSGAFRGCGWLLGGACRRTYESFKASRCSVRGFRLVCRKRCLSACAHSPRLHHASSSISSQWDAYFSKTASSRLSRCCVPDPERDFVVGFERPVVEVA